MVMSYYIYENWRAENKAVIHTGACGNCNNGKGCHENPLGDANGQWHGPFETLTEAERIAIATGKPVRFHRCTN